MLNGVLMIDVPEDRRAGLEECMGLDIQIIWESMDGALKLLQHHTCLLNVLFTNRSGDKISRTLLRDGCVLVVIGPRDFDWMTEILRGGAREYLSAELPNRAIADRLIQLLKNGNDPIPEGHRLAVRRYFIQKALYDLGDHPLDEASLNQLYCLTTSPGIYLALGIKIDYRDKTRGVETVERLRRDIMLAVRRRLGTLCSEICSELKFTDLIVYLNYDSELADDVRAAFPGIQREVQTIASGSGEAEVTVCVGSEQHTLRHWAVSRSDALQVVWSRRARGTGCVLYPLGDAPFSSTFMRQLSQTTDDTMQAVNRLDVEAFEHCVNRFFAMPTEIIWSRQGQHFLRKCKDYLFESYRTQIERFADYQQTYMDIRRACNMANSLEEYREAWLQPCLRLLSGVASESGGRKAGHMRRVLQWIEENYTRNIGLEDVAEAVQLTPNYLSTLFKQEMNRNFVDYLTGLRISAAKTLLEDSRLTVSEVAQAVGFSDARYFSRIFKRETGLRPSEYHGIRT